MLEHEAMLAERGIAQTAEDLGGDVRDALNLPLHFQRKPLATSAVVAALGLLLGTRASKVRGSRGSPGLLKLVRSFVQTTLVGAAVGKLRKAAGLERV